MTLEEILLSEDIINVINENLDYIINLIPEIKYMIGFEHKHPHHHLDVFNHTLLSLSLSKKDIDVRLTLLLHDIGKPFSYQEGEIRHFKNHPVVSANMAKTILKRLDYNDKYIEYISKLIERHDTPLTTSDINSDYEFCLTLFEIQKCDALAHNPNKLEKRKKYIKDIEKELQLKREKTNE